MSTVIAEISWNDNPIPVGTSVVIDSAVHKVRPYDSLIDNEADIVGVTVPKTLQASSSDTSCGAALKVEYFLVNEYLQYGLDENENYEENPNFDPTFNYAYDNKYAAVCICGVAGVNVNQTKPTRWKKLFSSPGDNPAVELHLIR